jgi:hypothetical protein
MKVPACLRQENGYHRNPDALKVKRKRPGRKTRERWAREDRTRGVKV